MALHVQLDLFDDPTDENIYLKRQMDALVLAQDKLRKGLFARHNELERNFGKQLLEFGEKLEAIERQLFLLAKNTKK
jgi:hypothetical protein